MALVDRGFFMYGDRQGCCGGEGKRSFANGQAGFLAFLVLLAVVRGGMFRLAASAFAREGCLTSAEE
jgi:hypothetical protein